MDFLFTGAFSSFLVVFTSEIGDKTFIILAILSQHQSISAILTGNQLAMTPLVIIAAYLGSLATFLPEFYLNLITLCLFLLCSVLAFAESFHEFSKKNYKKSKNSEKFEKTQEKEILKPLIHKITWLKAMTKTAGLIFLAEFGDISQISMLPLGAHFSPGSVILGAFFGFFLCAVLAVLTGKLIGKFVSEAISQIIAGLIFLGFASYSGYLLVVELRT